jgi:hypothetical protein
MPTRCIVTFTRSFHLSGFDGQQPAGQYSVEFDDLLMDGMTYAPYRQMATMVRVDEDSDNAIAGEMAVIEPKELQDVLAADAVADFPPGYGEVSQPATDRVKVPGGNLGITG